MGSIVELAHASSSHLDFRSATLAALRQGFGFDTAIFFTTGAEACAGPPAGYNKSPESRPIFQHYRDNYARLFGDLAKGRHASRRDGAFIDSDVYSLRERMSLPFFCEVTRPQGISQRLVAYLYLRGQELSVVQLCRHGRARPFSGRDLAAFRGLTGTLAVTDATFRLAEQRPSLAVEAREAARARVPAGELDVLSKREQQVVAQVRWGYSNSEIAVLLGTSRFTVRNQLARIYEKLGVANRSELAAWVALAEGDGTGDP